MCTFKKDKREGIYLEVKEISKNVFVLEICSNTLEKLSDTVRKPETLRDMV